jgi:hypothetical protein
MPNPGWKMPSLCTLTWMGCLPDSSDDRDGEQN